LFQALKKERLVSTTVATKTPYKSKKKGFVYAGLDNLNLDGLKTNWYYSYNTVNFNVEPVENGEFIPMINSTSSNLYFGFDQALLYRNTTLNVLYNKVPLGTLGSVEPIGEIAFIGYIDNVGVDYLLSVNEPDFVNIIDISTCLIIHKKIEDEFKPKKLGSPGVTRLNGLNYLTEFLKGNETYIPRCDFICLHWYEYSAIEFLSYIDYMWETFKKPIWVTEFSFVKWNINDPRPSDETAIKNFIDIALAGLESRSYVERYSWFSNFKETFIEGGEIKPNQLKEMSLWNSSGNLTTIGEYYFSR
jgi:hypothetical protein